MYPRITRDPAYHLVQLGWSRLLVLVFIFSESEQVVMAITLGSTGKDIRLPPAPLHASCFWLQAGWRSTLYSPSSTALLPQALKNLA